LKLLIKILHEFFTIEEQLSSPPEFGKTYFLHVLFRKAFKHLPRDGIV
jgi:hypothetical protein